MLLLEVTSRLKNCVREVDTVSRFGGDEFVVLLAELNTDHRQSKLHAQVIAEKIRVSLTEPYVLALRKEGKNECSIEHGCSASIGVVMFMNHDASEDDILKWADAAMYQAKAAGRNVIRFHEVAGSLLTAAIDDT